MIGEYEKAFPQQEIDVSDPDWAEFINKLNEDDLEIKALIEKLDTLIDYERMDSKLLKRFGEMFKADIRDTDSDLLKRAKIRYAVQSHKLGGTWKYDFKPLIDLLVGGNFYIYSTGHDNYGKWMFVTKPIPEGRDYAWSGCFAHTLYEPKLGMVFNAGTTGFPFVPFVCLIDIDFQPITSETLWDISSNGSKWCIVGNNGFVAYTEDFTQWNIASIPTSTNLRGIANDGTNWCAVGNNGVIITSTDLKNWTLVTSPDPYRDFLDIAYNGSNLWTLVGEDARIITSPDLENWTIRSTSPPSGFDLFGIDYGAGLWCGVGTDGLIVTSNNGTTWAAQYIGTAQDMKDVAYDGSSYWCAVGDNGKVAYTTDPTGSWTITGTGAVNNKSVEYGNGKWCVVSSAGGIFTSTNLTTWTQQYSPVTSILFGIIFTNGDFYACSSSGDVISSEDAVFWLFNTSEIFLDILDYELSRKAPPYMRVYIGTVISGEYVTYRILNPWND